MPKKIVTPESTALDNAIAQSGRSARRFADAVGAETTAVSQWRKGHRPMPGKYAVAAAKYLGIDDPGTISRGYREAEASVHGNLALKRGDASMGTTTPDHAMILALRDAVDSLRYVVATVTAVTIKHRPAEARDIARAMRDHLPADLAHSDLIRELLKALDAAGEP